MTEREIKISKAILDVLHGRQDGGLVSAMLVHGEVELLLEESVPAADFKTIFDQCDKRGWLIGVVTQPTGRRKYKISDEGEAARLQLV